MSQRADTIIIRPLRTLPKDIGVALVVVAALGLGLLLRFYVGGGSTEYKSSDSNFSMTYPSSWRSVANTDGALLKVEDPRTHSPYKTNMTVESRELDPSSPPTLQELVDRRVLQRSSLTGYHFLSSEETTVNGAKGARLEYAYVVQPIDTPRSASPPVVVHGREYIVVTKNRSYYVTLAAPESEFESVSGQFDSVMQSAKLQ